MTRTKHDITGQRFGKLVAICPTEERKYANVVWKCLCDCGNTKKVPTNSLVSGQTKSCGCLVYDGIGEGIASFNLLYKNYKGHAKDRRIFFLLSKEEFKNLGRQPCFYCGQIPKQKIQAFGCNGSYIYNGIDRLDNDKGYILDNCVPCCGMCNRAKNDRSFSEFVFWIEKTYYNLKARDILHDDGLHDFFEMKGLK